MASTKVLGASGSVLPSNNYHLLQYVLSTGGWNDLSSTDNGFDNNFMVTQANGFALNPSDDNDWWFYTNSCHRKMANSLMTNMCSGYSKTFHADLRDILVLRNGELLAGTDGGVYKSDNNGTSWLISSEGLGMSHPSAMAVSQQPPFYVASGFWHAGWQIYNPKENKWHYGVLRDGQDGEIFFLNKERYNFADQNSIYTVVEDFNNLTINYSAGDIKTSSSENRQGRAYGAKLYHSTVYPFPVIGSDLVFSNDDFTTTQIFAGVPAYQPHKFKPIVISNEPDKLIVYSNYKTTATGGYTLEKLDFFDGMNATVPNPNLTQTIELSLLFDPNLGEQSHFKTILFDARRNGKHWILLNNYSDWGYHNNRIVEFDPINNEYTDITYKTEDAIFNNGVANKFPGFVSITDMEMDRQTGILYI